MFKQVILLMLCCLSFSTMAQEDIIEKTVNACCTRLSQLEDTTLTKSEFKDEMSKIAHDLETKYDANLQEMAISVMAGLVDNCEAFVSLFRSIAPPCPKENATLKSLKIEVEKIIEENKELPYTVILEKLDDSYFTTLMGNQEQLNKDYEDGIVNPKLTDDTWQYLLHKSDEYLKIFIVSETVLQFK